MSMRWPPVIFVYRPKSFATCPMTSSPSGRDLAAGDARDDRVAAVLLDVRHDVVVRVLQGGVLAVEHVAVAEGGQDAGEHGLADVAAAAGAEALDDRAEGAQPRDAHGVEELRARVREVLAQRGAEARAAAGELGADELLDQRQARAARGAGAGARLHAGDVRAALVGHGAADRPGRHAVARAHERLVGQLGVRERIARRPRA